MNSDSALLIAPELFPTVEMYRSRASHGSTFVDMTMRHDKRRKASHRFTIADARGRLDVTIPVKKPDSYASAREADILLSDHAPWWDTAVTALESAYGRTPYFDYYIDSFLPFFTAERAGTPLWQFTHGLDCTLSKLFMLPEPVAVTDASQLPTGDAVTDLRRDMKIDLAEKPYWQVRADKFGFMAELSAVDLLFNLGPEAALYLRNLI